MADAPRARVKHWVVRAYVTVPADEEDLHSALLVARTTPGAAGCGGRGA